MTYSYDGDLGYPTRYDTMYDDSGVNYIAETETASIQGSSGRYVSKMEVSKSVTIRENTVTTIKPDHPDYECLSSVQVTTSVPYQITITEDQRDEGYDTLLVPHDPTEGEQDIITRKKMVEKIQSIKDNGVYPIVPDDPTNQILSKATAQVSIDKALYFNRKEVPSGHEIIITKKDQNDESPSNIINKKSVDKVITFTTNGEETITPSSNEIFKSITVKREIPQDIVINDDSLSNGTDVIVIPNAHPANEEGEKRIKSYEDKEVTITDNTTMDVTATNPDTQVLRKVTIHPNIVDTITVTNENPTPGYDTILAPIMDENGVWKKTQAGTTEVKKKVEKIVGCVENKTLEIVPGEKEILDKVIVNVDVPNINVYNFDEGILLPGYDTYVMKKEEDDQTPSQLYIGEKETRTIDIWNGGENGPYGPLGETNLISTVKVNNHLSVKTQRKRGDDIKRNNVPVSVKPDDGYLLSEAIVYANLNIKDQTEADYRNKPYTTNGEKDVIVNRESGTEGMLSSLAKIKVDVPIKPTQDYPITTPITQQGESEWFTIPIIQDVQGKTFAGMEQTRVKVNVQVPVPTIEPTYTDPDVLNIDSNGDNQTVEITCSGDGMKKGIKKVNVQVPVPTIDPTYTDPETLNITTNGVGQRIEIEHPGDGMKKGIKDVNVCMDKIFLTMDPYIAYQWVNPSWTSRYQCKIYACEPSSPLPEDQKRLVASYTSAGGYLSLNTEDVYSPVSGDTSINSLYVSFHYCEEQRFIKAIHYFHAGKSGSFPETKSQKWLRICDMDSNYQVSYFLFELSRYDTRDIEYKTVLTITLRVSGRYYLTEGYLNIPWLYSSALLESIFGTNYDNSSFSTKSFVSSDGYERGNTPWNNSVEVVNYDLPPYSIRWMGFIHN